MDVSALAPSEAHAITYAATIFGGVAPGSALTNVVNVEGSASVGDVRSGGTSSATVTVLDGPFSTRRIVTGRAFLDDARTGIFERRDRVLANVRVVMEDGSFALTDANGQYSVPAVRPGMHVLRLDPLTLPTTAKAKSDAPIGSPHALQQLVHGVLDDATMENVDLAVEPAS